MFDNDGTLWCERPTYAQFAFFADRLRAVVEADPAGVVLAGAPDIWTPTTAPLPALLPAPVPTGSAPSTE